MVWVTPNYLFTDASCFVHRGRAGWAALVRRPDGSLLLELSGGEFCGQINRMELFAVIRGLAALPGPTSVEVYTDSKYVVTQAREWRDAYLRRKWRLAGLVKANEDLWLEFVELCGVHQVSVRWVRGHSGHPDNERVDTLARKAAIGMLKQVRKTP